MEQLDPQEMLPDLDAAVRFVASSNVFLDRINLEFGMREVLSLDALLSCVRNPNQSEATQSATMPPYSRRILLSSDSRLYSIVAISWPPGACTPVHSHYTWCTFMVTKGTLTERRFELSFTGRGSHASPRALASTELQEGDLRSDERFGGVHQLCNETQEIAVSLHCYGVEGARSATHVNRIFHEAA